MNFLITLSHELGLSRPAGDNPITSTTLVVEVDVSEGTSDNAINALGDRLMRPLATWSLRFARASVNLLYRSEHEARGRFFNSSNGCMVYVKHLKAQIIQDQLIQELEGKEAILGSDIAEKKVRFLQAYDPGPHSEDFRGDVTFVGSDMVSVFAHRFIMVITALAFAGL
ncbi:hypothetical protein AXG93_1247s1230 [Marchantia polymorpha subsp. ruderalis]|uniref:Uncharacterized protein n=1 Tax=Marchantia polymorpha subsp. ruderalis TaxID=1480154 RepID=A0A176WN31_MARPO|nr:hypothetical protein AXG93_1247s1230 [Marchantia polymorpha subsp. ruderalis]